MIYKGLISITNYHYNEFCKVNGNIISRDVVSEFLAQVDDVRYVNKKYIDYLMDYVLDFNLIGC